MKKRVFVGLIFILLIAGFVGMVAAVDDATDTGATVDAETAQIDKAYSCLESQIGNKTSLSLQEALFSVLAIGWSNKANVTIESEKRTDCWPKSGCRLKDTAQALLAYDRVGKDTSNIEAWIIGQNMSITDLNWYIEIDTSNKISSCTLNYGSQSTNVNIGADMKLSSSGGNCIGVSSNGYWLSVSRSLGCLDKSYVITCDQDFVTTTLYQKSAETTVFVSSETHGATAGGTTNEEVGGKCFRSNAGCDYEGSLWAAVALKKVGYDVSAFIPYILALAEDNQRYFPSAFAYLLTERQDQYGDVAQSQKQNKYWEITSSPYNKYYDTSLGMLSLIGTNAAERENAKEYLLDVQTSQGCWNNNNIRDTAFILYSGWQRGVSPYGAGKGTSEIFCQDVGKYCETPEACIGAGGQSSTETCPGFGETVCCSAKAVEETCFEKNGVVCGSSERCSLAPVSSADGSCCLGTCEPISVSPITSTQCEENFGTCKVFCDSGESASDESCGADSGLICCQYTGEQAGGLGWWWLLIILLIILIILAALGIVYKDKVRVWWMKHKKKAEVKPVARGGMPGRPPFGRPLGGTPFGTRPLAGRGMVPSKPGQQRPLPLGVRPGTKPVTRPGMPPARPAPSKPKSQKEKEFEETLKKLKDMGK